jgi:hypothetical protein
MSGITGSTLIRTKQSSPAGSAFNIKAKSLRLGNFS